MEFTLREYLSKLYDIPMEEIPQRFPHLTGLDDVVNRHTTTLLPYGTRGLAYTRDPEAKFSTVVIGQDSVGKKKYVVEKTPEGMSVDRTAHIVEPHEIGHIIDFKNKKRFEIYPDEPIDTTPNKKREPDKEKEIRAAVQSYLAEMAQSKTPLYSDMSKEEFIKTLEISTHKHDPYMRYNMDKIKQNPSSKRGDIMYDTYQRFTPTRKNEK
jgi:hypothetical protein